MDPTAKVHCVGLKVLTPRYIYPNVIYCERNILYNNPKTIFYQQGVLWPWFSFLKALKHLSLLNYYPVPRFKLQCPRKPTAMNHWLYAQPVDLDQWLHGNCRELVVSRDIVRFHPLEIVTRIGRYKLHWFTSLSLMPKLLVVDTQVETDSVLRTDVKYSDVWYR